MERKVSKKRESKEETPLCLTFIKGHTVIEQKKKNKRGSGGLKSFQTSFTTS